MAVVPMSTIFTMFFKILCTVLCTVWWDTGDCLAVDGSDVLEEPVLHFKNDDSAPVFSCLRRHHQLPNDVKNQLDPEAFGDRFTNSL